MATLIAQITYVQHNTDQKSDQHQVDEQHLIVRMTDVASTNVPIADQQTPDEAKFLFNDEECFIGKEVIGKLREDGTGEAKKTTHCGHRFGDECLRDWLVYGSTCPMCRIPLRALTIEEILEHFDDLGVDVEIYEDVATEYINPAHGEDGYVCVTGAIIPWRVFADNPHIAPWAAREPKEDEDEAAHHVGGTPTEGHYVRVLGVFILRCSWEDNPEVAPWAIRVPKEIRDEEKESEDEEADNDKEDSDDEHSSDDEEEGEFEEFSDDEEDSVHEDEIYGYEDDDVAESDRGSFPDLDDQSRSYNGRLEYIELMERMNSLDVNEQLTLEW